MLNGSFWELYVNYPWYVIFMVVVLLTGSYILLKLFGAIVTVCLCRLKGIRVSDGLPVGTALGKDELGKDD